MDYTDAHPASITGGHESAGGRILRAGIVVLAILIVWAVWKGPLSQDCVKFGTYAPQCTALREKCDGMSGLARLQCHRAVNACMPVAGAVQDGGSLTDPAIARGAKSCSRAIAGIPPRSAAQAIRKADPAACLTPDQARLVLNSDNRAALKNLLAATQPIARWGIDVGAHLSPCAT